MPTLAPGRTISQRTPELKVTNRFEAGKYRFRLTVVDSAGNESRPSELVVTVRPRATVVVPQPGVVIGRNIGIAIDPGRINLNNLNNRGRPR